jgi:hypothetical protein
MRVLFAILIFALGSFSVISQQQSDVWLEGRLKGGFLLAHRSNMGHLAQQHAVASEFSYYYRPNSERLWCNAYRNPYYGFTLFAGTVGNADALGSYYGGYGFMSFPFIQKGFYSFGGKVGIGFAYATKIYDAEENIYNLAIGSHVNALICMGLESKFVFGANMMSLNFDMTHFSNGATKVPNLGINIPYVSVGYSRRIKEADKVPEDFVCEPYDPNFEFGVMGLGSVKQVYPISGRNYAVFGLNLIGRRYFNVKRGMEVSLDFISKQSTKDFHADIPKTQMDLLQLGGFVGYIIPIDRLHLVVGMGGYIRDKYRPDGPFYHRLGVRYRFENGINFNLTLKSHWAKADYVEYGIGYTFKR